VLLEDVVVFVTLLGFTVELAVPLTVVPVVLEPVAEVF
jgi:hypothetical protein